MRSEIIIDNDNRLLSNILRKKKRVGKKFIILFKLNITK